MRGLGASRGRVFLSFFLEQTLLALAGCAFGGLVLTALGAGGTGWLATAGFLICYLAVFVVAIRLRHDIHASLPILIVGTLVMLLVIVGFIYSLWSQGSRALIWIIGALLLSLIVAMVMKRNKTV